MWVWKNELGPCPKISISFMGFYKHIVSYLCMCRFHHSLPYTYNSWRMIAKLQITKPPQVLYWYMVIHVSCAYVLHVKIAHANLSFAKTHKNLWHKFCASVTCHDIFQCQLLTIVFKENKLGVDYFTINLTSNVKLK